MQVLTVILLASLCYLCVQADSIVVPPTDITTIVPDTPRGNETVAKPDVYNFNVHSDIRFRFAHTVISSRIANPANVAQEVSFTAVLPETAFISGFLMEIDGKVYNAYVKEKEAAKQEYDEAVRAGRTAAHVALSARDSNRFTVSVNVEPLKKVTFNLTYEELLNRKLGSYKHVINLDPGQIVKDFSVEVQIDESSDITSLEVPALHTSNEIEADPSTGATNPLAIIERPTPHSAIVKFAPTPEQQRDLATDGIKGQLIIQYDVDRTSHSGEVLVNNGYFVHFFAPPNLPPLSKQVTFVLDVSGSMYGRKIEQLRQAMTIILDDLNPGDLFSIIIFSNSVQVWDYALSEAALQERLQNVGSYSRNDDSVEEAHETLSPTVIATATPENISKAKAFVKLLTNTGGTNIYGGLIKALEVSRLEHKHTHANSSAEGPEQKPEPIIIFLTDGQPNIGISDPNTIVLNVTGSNTENSSIFSLALGNDADLSFLKKLSLRNSGFARKIYEASDTALQLRDFYRQVASPLLANVTFKYQPGQVDEGSVTKQTFRRLFGGAELVVAGRLLEDNITSEVQGLTSSGSTIYPFIPICCILPPPPPKNTSDAIVSSTERLWAYLTIQQLLEEDEAKDYNRNDKNQTSPEKQRALELALKYSFVTPLTSLVVVKPNETSSVDTEDASDPGHDGGIRLYASKGFAAGPPLPLPPAAGGFGGSLGFSPMSGFADTRIFAAPESAIVLPANPDYPSTPRDFQLTTTVSYTGLYPQPVLANLSDVTWISESDNTITLPTGINGTTEVLQLASSNETDTAHTVCSTPKSESGHCRHFRYCVLDSFITDQAQFLPYFCRIDSFVGVCCPDNIHTNVS